RLGGDEFIMIMPDTSRQHAEEMAETIIDSIKEAIHHSFGSVGENVTVSIGISLAPDDGVDLDSLYKQADIALYTAKEKGKNQYQFYQFSNNHQAM
ncbi:MAG: GGDEF domain-containing protein, partial [Clostridia bacterium]